jgi:hypothetical protein
MKRKLYFPLLLLLIFIQFPLFGVHSHASHINQEDHPVLQTMVPLNRAQLETQLGRKLTIKERIGLSLLKTGIAKDKNHLSATDSPTAGRTNGFGIAGFIVGLASLFVAGIPLGIAAIVFSIIAMGQIQEKGQKGRGFAIAGWILGALGLVGAIILIAAA